MIDTKALREKVLDLAMRGKLVEQDDSDEPVSALLNRIKEEKEQMVNNKIIKKEAKLPIVTKKNSPFILPTGWKWERLGNLSKKIHYGYTASALNNGNAKFLRITDIQKNNVNWLTVPFCEINEQKLNNLKLEKYDILIARTGGTIGKSFMIKKTAVDAVFASYLIRVQLIEKRNANFIKLFLESPLYWKLLTLISFGTGQPNVNAKNLSLLSVPVPPIEEQERIVNKVDELFSMIDHIESELKAFDELANQLDKKILELAMRGKLVSQDSNDEPASELLKQIKSEKEKLIQEKKLKKEKPLLPIKKEEIPFEIPGNWEWVKINEVNNIIMGQSPKGANIFNIKQNEYFEFHQGKTDFGAKYISNSSKYTNELTRVIEKKAVLLSVRAPVGDVNLLDRTIVIGRGICAIIPIFLNLEYLYFFFKTKKRDLELKSTGTTFKSINGDTVRNIVMPIPSINEQKRIVNKIEKLLTLTNNLKNDKKN